MSEHYDNKFKGFLNGKGFYLVLALCLAGASAAAYIAMDTAADRAVQKQPPQSLAAKQEIASPLLEAEGKQQGVKVESSSASSSSSKEQSSSKPQSKPAAESKRSDVPVSFSGSSFELPIAGEVFNPYSNGELVKSETLGDWRTHNGIDIEAKEGTAVKSACAGQVVSAKSDSLWGYVVEINHSNGVSAKYCGLSKQLSVKAGDKVKKGQVIGLVGYAPCESAMPNHLHFECKKDGKYIDPMSLVK